MKDWTQRLEVRDKVRTKRGAKVVANRRLRGKLAKLARRSNRA